MKNILIKVLLAMLLPVFAHGQLEPTSGPTGCDESIVSALLCSLDALDGYIGSLENTQPDYPPCPLITDCGVGISCDNNIWFSFVATCSEVTLTIDPFNCGPGFAILPYGMQGQVLKTIKTESNSPTQLDLNDKASGAYYIELQSDKGLISKRMIKE